MAFQLDFSLSERKRRHRSPAMAQSTCCRRAGKAPSGGEKVYRFGYSDSRIWFPLKIETLTFSTSSDFSHRVCGSCGYMALRMWKCSQRRGTCPGLLASGPSGLGLFLALSLASLIISVVGGG